ncbi:hypothetical protein GQ53DRAFT_754785 [Thozetella sp. PMI_491]|nr:hypothetical protein GQ53DRAFT_754785 [Thozetella sp. PMI_491]
MGLAMFKSGHDAFRDPGRSRVERWVAILCVSILLAGSALLVIAQSAMLVNPQLGSINTMGSAEALGPMDCGNSTAEAKAKGCVYDLMASGWMPQPCYQKEISDKYLARDEWKFYSEEGGGVENEISYDMAKEGRFDRYYTTNGFHVGHCLYGWERYWFAVEHDLPVDKQAKMPYHSRHCSEYIMSNLKHDSVKTLVISAYFACERP